MGVGVQCKAGVCVSEDARQGLGIHATICRVGGEGVAQIVEANQRKLRVFEDPIESNVYRLFTESYSKNCPLT